MNKTEAFDAVQESVSVSVERAATSLKMLSGLINADMLSENHAETITVIHNVLTELAGIDAAMASFGKQLPASYAAEWGVTL